MNLATLPKTIAICDTTLCDTEFIPKLNLSLQQKILLAHWLAAMGVDVLQIGYPGKNDKQLNELFILSKKLQEVTLCGAAGSQPEEIASVAVALKPAIRGRINVLTAVERSHTPSIHETDLLAQIRESVSLAREYCAEVAWSMIGVAEHFADHHTDCLCRSIETAIYSGATAITLVPAPTINPASLVHVIQQIMHRVVNIERATVGLNWHYSTLTIDTIRSLLLHGIKHIEGRISRLNRYTDLTQDRMGWDTVVRAIDYSKNRTQFHTQWHTCVDLRLLDRVEAILDGCQSPNLVDLNKIPQMGESNQHYR